MLNTTTWKQSDQKVGYSTGQPALSIQLISVMKKGTVQNQKGLKGHNKETNAGTSLMTQRLRIRLPEGKKS